MRPCNISLEKHADIKKSLVRSLTLQSLFYEVTLISYCKNLPGLRSWLTYWIWKTSLSQRFIRLFSGMFVDGGLERMLGTGSRYQVSAVRWVCSKSSYRNPAHLRPRVGQMVGQMETLARRIFKSETTFQELWNSNLSISKPVYGSPHPLTDP